MDEEDVKTVVRKKTQFLTTEKRSLPASFKRTASFIGFF